MKEKCFSLSFSHYFILFNDKNITMSSLKVVIFRARPNLFSFELIITLPLPRVARLIIARDGLGRIVHSSCLLLVGHIM